MAWGVSLVEPAANRQNVECRGFLCSVSVLVLPDCVGAFGTLKTKRIRDRAACVMGHEIWQRSRFLGAAAGVSVSLINMSTVNCIPILPL
jgi:hypothetical protein